MYVFSIRDVIAEQFGPLFVAENSGVALRNYRQLIKDTPTIEKDEYKLFMLGEVDMGTGALVGMVPSLVEIEERSK